MVGTASFLSSACIQFGWSLLSWGKYENFFIALSDKKGATLQCMCIWTATMEIKMQIHVWDTRIIIKNTLVSPGAYVRGPHPSAMKVTKTADSFFTAFLQTEPSFSSCPDFQRFSLSLQVGNSHKDLVIVHLNYCNGPFSAPAQLHPFRYFPKKHFLLYCSVQDTTFPPPSYHSNQNHTHQHSHSFINRVDSQAGGDPSIILSNFATRLPRWGSMYHEVI